MRPSRTNRRIGIVTAFPTWTGLVFALSIVMTGAPVFGFGTPPAMDQLEWELGRPIEIDTLVEIIADEAHHLRRLAVCAAGDLGADAKALVPQLTRLLADDDWFIRSHAAHALSRMGAAAAPAIPALIRALADPKKNVCCHAAVALGEIGSRDESIINALVARLSDTNEADEQGEAALSNVARGIGSI